MGPHGPEVLTYELVRTVLRDDRFAMPKGLALAAQGITSGELWDIQLKGLLSLDGADHHRQRWLVSKAFAPRAAERLRTTCSDIIAELVDNHADTGRCHVVADIARQYPIPIICAMLGTPREIVTRLHASISKVLAMADVREKLLAAGIEPASSKTPEELAAFIRSQADTRAKVIQAVGMKLD